MKFKNAKAQKLNQNDTLSHKDLTSLNRHFTTFIINQLNEFCDFAIIKYE